MNPDELQSWFDPVAEYIGNPVVGAALIALLFIIFGKIADWIISAVVGRLAARSKTDFDDRLIVALHRPIFVTFVLIGLGLASYRLGLPPIPLYVTVGLLQTIGVAIWYGALSAIATLVIQTMSRRRASKLVQSGMLSLLQIIVKIALVALSVYFVFLAWDIDVTAWMASAGIVGLALSFAAKDSLSNLFAGVSIVADAPYKTGDFITLDSGQRGIVTHIGLRSTRLLTRDDVEITIPNGIIGNSVITNEAGGPSEKHRIRVAVGVAYGTDMDLVIRTLEQVAADNSEVCERPEPRVRFRRFGDSSLDVELLCWIARPVDRGRMHHELNLAVYKAFSAEEIEIPFPQRDLHVRTMPSTAS